MVYDSSEFTYKMPDGKIDILNPIPPEAQASKLDNLVISHDSVVVTAILTPKPNHKIAQVNWGDGNIDLIDFSLPQFQPPAEGSYKIQHEYKKNPITNLYPNFVLVVIAVYDDSGNSTFEGQGILLKPRFKCVIYPVRVKANHHDSGFDKFSEFDINLRYQQGENELLNKKWRWEPKTLEIDFFSTTLIVAERYLDGSQFSTEMTFQDEPIIALPSYVDDDGGWGFFSKLTLPVDIFGDFLDDFVDFEGDQQVILPVHPKYREGQFEFVYHLSSGSKYMDFYFSGSMDVIVPLDRGLIASFRNPT